MEQGIEIILLAILPISELRGAIPLGISLGYNPISVFLISVIFNSLVFFPVYFGLKWFYEKFFSKFAFVRNIIEKIQKKGSRYIEKYEILGITLFVAIPLPFTGAYSGSILAWFFGLDWKRSYLAVLLGVTIAGIIMTLISLGILNLWLGF